VVVGSSPAWPVIDNAVNSFTGAAIETAF